MQHIYVKGNHLPVPAYFPRETVTTSGTYLVFSPKNKPTDLVYDLEDGDVFPYPGEIGYKFVFVRELAV